MKATILIDNLTKGALVPEWGLSIYIEYNGHKILLDTGASGCFARNAENLGIDLASVELGVLSHAGADHIIEEVQETYPKENIYAMAGGFHLYRTSPEDIRALARKLRKAGIGNIYTGHCTGSEAFEILRDELGEQAVQIYTGMEIVI